MKGIGRLSEVISCESPVIEEFVCMSASELRKTIDYMNSCEPK